MKTRKTPRKIPTDNPIYFQLDVLGQGTLDWRMPFPLRLALIEEAYIKTQFEAEPGATQLSKASEGMLIAGAAIGLCWAHQTLDLEAKFQNDLRAYGEQVVEELHENGWSAATRNELVRDLMGKVRESLQISAAEVKERSDFLEAQPEGIT